MKSPLTDVYTDGICTPVSGLQIVKGNPARLKRIRTKLNLSQAKFAEVLGVRTNTVARWERGDLVPPKVAELAAEYLLITYKSGKGDKKK